MIHGHEIEVALQPPPHLRQARVGFLARMLRPPLALGRISGKLRGQVTPWRPAPLP